MVYKNIKKNKACVNIHSKLRPWIILNRVRKKKDVKKIQLVRYCVLKMIYWNIKWVLTKIKKIWSKWRCHLMNLTVISIKMVNGFAIQILNMNLAKMYIKNNFKQTPSQNCKDSRSIIHLKFLLTQKPL